MGPRLLVCISSAGASVALVERDDWASGASSKYTKLLHGGIRYLLTGDIRQMREGLSERATWARIAPSNGS